MKKILIGVPVKNTGKYLDNLFNQIEKLSYDKSEISIVLLEGDSVDNSYQTCLDLQKNRNFYSNFDVEKFDLGFHLDHNFDRYKKTMFPQRIKNLVIVRNYIVNKYLKNNDYLWWVDSDFEIIPPNTVCEFINCNKDVVIPILTHKKWGFHDCGSVIFDGDKQKRFQLDTSSTMLIKLDRADTHCFINRKVFDSGILYSFIEKEYIDGCGNIQDCYSDGTQFSFDCINRGFSVFGAKHIIIQHQNV